ncbi:MAG: heparan-alpha-glucosaminide N-acetyltransferase domain-containing protein [Vicinamibacterales bacterium]
MSRRAYLDWLRGIAVLIMIEAHTLDSWTLVSERGRVPFGYAMILGGFGAPIFLFLAGLALVLAIGGRMRKGASAREAAAAARVRGWQIFGLAFLFRLQSWLLGGGAPLDTLLKVDILNIMGLAMVGAAALWGLAGRDAVRAALLVAAVVALTMLTPIVRATPWLAALPDPVEWYLRPYPGRTTFTLLPWAGFLFAGAALGLSLDRARTPQAERRLILALAAFGPGMAAAAYAASFLPAIYTQTSFWTSSPTFFFLRLGVLLSLVPLAYAISSALRRVSAPLEYFGRVSLFVYWIHVEMVYGVLSAGIHKRLTFEQSLLAFAAFSLFLFGVAKAKDALAPRFRRRPGTSSWQPARG